MERQLPIILNGKFYKIVSEKNGKVVAKCMNCPNQEISGSVTSTSNFRRHLELKHPGLITKFELYKDEIKHKRKQTETEPHEYMPSTKKSAKTCNAEAKSSFFSAYSVTQNQVDNLVTNYIISEMRPLSVVEKPAFINLVKGLAPSRTVMCRKTLTSRIKNAFDDVRKKVMKCLEEADYICTTADIWSVNNRSYMGVTAHWISEDLIRHGVVLACRRFCGSHTYNTIADMLNDIHSEYHLHLGKITHTVTDNASNFSKAFTEFGINQKNNDDDGDQDELIFENLTEIINSEVNIDDTLGFLPPHKRCVCHTLNLIGTTDADKATKTGAYSRIYHTSMGKCQGIWNAIHRSSKASDAVAEICGEKPKIICPCITRWYSKYTAIARILDLTEKLSEICHTLNLPQVKPCEIEFLQEYTTVMEPLYSTLTLLEGEKNCFFGMLLPSLFKLRNQLQVISNTKMFNYARPLLSCVLQGLSNRFGDFFELDTRARDEILSAVSHPQFKLRWVPPSKREEVRALFEQHCSTFQGIQEVSMGEENVVDDEYGYGETPIETRPGIVMEVTNYLANNSSELNILMNYPTVQKIFKKYNTTLPSSAPVERLFSIAGLIETPRRNKLSDEMFEKLLYLKKNKHD